METLLKNQHNFEKSLTAYEEKIKAIQQSADQLIQKDHVDSGLISKRCREVLENWERLKTLATAKIGNLGESRKLFQFLRDAEEVRNNGSLYVLLFQLNMQCNSINEKISRF